jgi:hypothetical protein
MRMMKTVWMLWAVCAETREAGCPTLIVVPSNEATSADVMHHRMLEYRVIVILLYLLHTSRDALS